MFPNSQQDCHIVFFTKPGCALCDKAMGLFETLSKRHPIRLRTVNILTDPVLYDTFGERIPVFLFPDGTTVEAPVHAGDIRRALKRCAKTSRH
jgi:thiol-disulfide isomerase/thioredoxin